MRTAKAWVAALMAILTAVTVVLTDDVIVNEEITDLVSIVIGSALTLWTTYRVPNAPPPPVTVARSAFSDRG